MLLLSLLPLYPAAVLPFAQTRLNPTIRDRRAIDAIFQDLDKPTSPCCALAAYQDDRVVFKRSYGRLILSRRALSPLPSSTFSSVSTFTVQPSFACTEW